MIPVRAYFRLLVDYLRPMRGRVALLSAVLLTSIGLQLLNPQIVRVFLDRVTEGAGQEELIPLALWFMGIAVVHQVLTVYSTYLAEDIGWTATNEMRARLANHLLHLDMGFHKSTTPGELIERIDGDVTALSNFFSAFMIRVVGNGVLLTTEPNLSRNETTTFWPSHCSISERISVGRAPILWRTGVMTPPSWASRLSTSRCNWCGSP